MRFERVVKILCSFFIFIHKVDWIETLYKDLKHRLFCVVCDKRAGLWGGRFWENMMNKWNDNQEDKKQNQDKQMNKYYCQHN